MRPQQREEALEILTTSSDVIWGIGIASVQEIDQLNILKATMMAMKHALDAMSRSPERVFVDGRDTLDISVPVHPVVKGDQSHLAIAAASIIAKVTRDRLMATLHGEFPVYGWDTNQGYGTKKHQEALATHGISPYHRTSFAPIRALL